MSNAFAGPKLTIGGKSLGDVTAVTYRPSPPPPEDFLAVTQTLMSKLASKLNIPMNLSTSGDCNFASARADMERIQRMGRSWKDYTHFATPIVTCDWMADRVWTQVRFPRSKKKRIQKKWRKDSRNFRIVETPWPAYMCNGTLFCHTRTYLDIKRQLMLDGEVFVAGKRIIDPLRITTRESNDERHSH